jgi:hypothetical protein
MASKAPVSIILAMVQNNWDEFEDVRKKIEKEEEKTKGRK